MGTLPEARLPRIGKRAALTVACLALALYFVVSGVVGAMNARSLEEEERQMRQEVVEQRARKEALLLLRDYLYKPEFVISEARRQLGLVFPGETEIIVVGPEDPERDASGQSWWEALFGFDPEQESGAR